MRAFDGTGALPPEKAEGGVLPETVQEGAALCADRGEGAGYQRVHEDPER